MRLSRAGWSLGEFAVHSAAGLRWVVEGINGENRIEARGRTQSQAWNQALAQAQAVGMAGRVRRKHLCS